MQQNIKLGWIGLGVMGEPMCRHLIAANYEVNVYTRSKEKAANVIDKGAIWYDSPVNVAEASDIIFTMVGTGQEVKDIYFSENGLFASNINGKIFIDMGTTAPLLTQQIVTFATEHGATSIDAPVSGGDVGARNASLSIMAGGDGASLNRVAELFSRLGKVRVMGKAGSGQHTKMCNQIVVAGTMIGVCEALLYAKHAGLDCETMLSAIRPGAAGCWTLDNLAPRIINQDYTSGFMVDHFIKDLSIAVEESDRMRLTLPGLSLAKQLYEKVRDLGHGKSATQALLLALESINHS